MWKSNLIIALRVLGRNRTISLINVIGLSAALAVVVLCLLFVRHETSYDSWHEKGDRIFLIYSESQRHNYKMTYLRSELRDAVRTTVAGIRESVHMHLVEGKVSYGESSFEGRFLAVDPAFLTLFTLSLAAGDPSTALDEPHSVVLAHGTARKYFGSDIPVHAMLGERIRLNHVERDRFGAPKETIGVERIITGVLAPLPGPSILHMEVIVPEKTAEELRFLGAPGLFIELEGGVNPAEFETRLAQLGTQYGLGDRKASLKLVPFKDAHFGPEILGPAAGAAARSSTAFCWPGWPLSCS